MVLQDYVKHVHTSACFDTIAEIQNAMSNNDNAGAMFHLGELKEQVWLLHNYIESLETPTTARQSPETSVAVGSR